MKTPVSLIILLLLTSSAYGADSTKPVTSTAVQAPTSWSNPNVVAPTTAAGANAYNTAGSEKSNQSTAGITGIISGSAMAAGFCSDEEWVLCAVSIAGAVESIGTMSNAGSNTDPSRNPLSASFDACSYDASLCNTSGAGDTTSSPYTAAAQDAISSLRTTAASQGLNIDDPASVSAYMANHAADMTDAAVSKAMASLSPAQLERMEKIKKDVASKFHVTSVATEGGGGGGGFNRGGKGHGSGLDLAALLNQAGGDKMDRNTASLNGLQKSLGGEPIGVAADNIFKQVSRRYESKIKTKSFLQK